ncbi:MAG: VIT domain-containing protein, partial [Methanobacteriota archaeon]
DVNNGYAVTTVEEKLTNTLDIPAEDEFRFLIPDEAFISGFTLIIDGKTIEYKDFVMVFFPQKKNLLDLINMRHFLDIQQP